MAGDTKNDALAARLDAEFGRRALCRAAFAIIARLAVFSALVVIGSRFLPG